MVTVQSKGKSPLLLKAVESNFNIWDKKMAFFSTLEGSRLAQVMLQVSCMVLSSSRMSPFVHYVSWHFYGAHSKKIHNAGGAKCFMRLNNCLPYQPSQGLLPTELPVTQPANQPQVNIIALGCWPRRMRRARHVFMCDYSRRNKWMAGQPFPLHISSA